MEVTIEPFERYPIPLDDRDFFKTVFTRVEYVMEPPTEGSRKWGVIYINPHNEYYMQGDVREAVGTQSKIDIINSIIENDSEITVGDSLTLPLTEEQIVSSPKAVIEIIKQFDREQWKEFCRGNYLPTVEILARGAGIEPPVE